MPGSSSPKPAYTVKNGQHDRKTPSRQPTIFLVNHSLGIKISGYLCYTSIH